MSLNNASPVKLPAAGVGEETMVAGFGPESVLAKNIEKWDMDADIVIMGAGGAGLAAAIEASRLGAEVVILEKMSTLGGSSLICGGALAFAGTDMQAAQGIEDSNELLYRDLMTVGENMNVPALVRAYVDNQLQAYEWLKEMGVKFLSVSIAAGMSVPRCHRAKASGVIKILRDTAKSNGVKILVNTAGQRLVKDEGNGKIRGVIADVKGKRIGYGAKQGVILASGGFVLNKGLLEKFVPAMAKAKAIVGRGSDGDGLKMAWACGADLQDMPYIKATFGFDLEGKRIASDVALVFYQGAIIVNKEGKRFVNESKSYKLIGDASLVQTDAMGFQIYDSAIRGENKQDPLSAIDRLEKRGRIYSAPSLEELAEKIGICPATLKGTVREYNANVAKGCDLEFGRKTLVAGYGKPVPIQTAPFYAFPSTAVILGTYGGLLINERAQVLDVFGNVIPGLYAAGEISGGVHGVAYMTGTAFAKSLIFGRIAAKNVMAENNA